MFKIVCSLITFESSIKKWPYNSLGTIVITLWNCNEMESIQIVTLLVTIEFFVLAVKEKLAQRYFECCL